MYHEDTEMLKAQRKMMFNSPDPVKPYKYFLKKQGTGECALQTRSRFDRLMGALAAIGIGLLVLYGGGMALVLSLVVLMPGSAIVHPWVAIAIALGVAFLSTRICGNGPEMQMIYLFIAMTPFLANMLWGANIPVSAGAPWVAIIAVARVLIEVCAQFPLTWNGAEHERKRAFGDTMDL